MTSPAPGKFVTPDDVTGRFEGDFPADRMQWLSLRIADVESELMGWVPSLRKSVDQINADSAAAGDPDRLSRVKRLICDKVLDLFRNPDGASTSAITTPDITISRAYSPATARGQVVFTEAELDTVRLRKQRVKFGSFTVQPGRITQPGWPRW
ncbi:hypothetical protein [Mycobacterium heckeshornense]|uniref:hypothetical protein n=1 Tax=Mycobacterium heckeshornense TaxID=110505 RepID=UPI000661FD61|nr:hypothetical protein [Mycobacterium heckeshornense]KMV23340.1 hypothetical protein ACT16_06620 [Mycobacterium heckeshornense]